MSRKLNPESKVVCVSEHTVHDGGEREKQKSVNLHLRDERRLVGNAPSVTLLKNGHATLESF
jgi:hypothetical protein